MTDKVYPADKVDLMLKAASEAMRGVKDYASQVQAENNQLKAHLAKQATADKVVLEKVASASADKITEFVAMLVDRSIIPESNREKYASACLASPDATVGIAIEALKLSESPESQGRGIKSASVKSDTTRDELEDENDLWLRAVSADKWD